MPQRKRNILKFVVVGYTFGVFEMPEGNFQAFQLHKGQWVEIQHETAELQDHCCYWILRHLENLAEPKAWRDFLKLRKKNQ